MALPSTSWTPEVLLDGATLPVLTSDGELIVTSDGFIMVTVDTVSQYTDESLPSTVWADE